MVKFSPKDQAALEIALQFEKKDINGILSDYGNSLDVLMHLTQTLHDAKVQLPHWKAYMEIFLIEFSIQSSSLLKLSEGVMLKSKVFDGKPQPPVEDINTMYLICRSLIERYILFYYLYIEPSSDAEGEFRYYVYFLAGLRERQKFKPSTPEYLRKQQDELIQIEDYKNNLRANSFFQSLASDKQGRYVNDNPNSAIHAKTDGFAKLINRSPLRAEWFESSWSLYSNYAHSEMIGAMQFQSFAEDATSRLDMKMHTVQKMMMLSSILVLDLTAMFPSARTVYS